MQIRPLAANPLRPHCPQNECPKPPLGTMVLFCKCIVKCPHSVPRTEDPPTPKAFPRAHLSEDNTACCFEFPFSPPHQVSVRLGPGLVPSSTGRGAVAPAASPAPFSTPFPQLTQEQENKIVFMTCPLAGFR